MITKESTSSKHSKINNDFSSAFTGFHKMSTTSSPTIIFLRLSGIQHMLPNNFPFLCNSTITLEYISQPSLQLSDFSCTNTILHSSQVNHQLFQPKYPVPLEATSKGLPRGYSRSVCVCVRPPALRKLRTYDVVWWNDAWRTPPDATALPMASSHYFTHPHQVSARLVPPLRCCAVPLVLPLRAHPCGRLCFPRIGLVVNKIYIRIFCDHVNVLNIFDQKSGCSSTMGTPHRWSSSPIFVSRPDATTKPMTSSHHFAPPRRVSVRLAPLVWSSAVFLVPRWSETSISAVSSGRKCRKYKGFELNMNIKSTNIFSDTVDALTATFAVWTRPLSKGRSSATNQG